jgi:SAM-dependent methyltransferase
LITGWWVWSAVAEGLIAYCQGYAKTVAIEAGQQQEGTGSSTRVRRLNWGCGRDARRGWINADWTAGPGVNVVADIREGLPIENETIDYAVAVHALQELAYTELGPALAELHRILRAGGSLRVVVPDLDADIRAYMEHDDDFLVPADPITSRGGRFIAHILESGRFRTPFTFDFAEELLVGAGFVDVTRCTYGETASGFQEIVELDSRERESIFIEATRPPGKRPFLEVLEVLHMPQGDGRLAGCNLDAPRRGFRSHDGSLEIVGWVVGRESRASEVQVLADGEVIGGAPVEVGRSGVARGFAQFPGSRSAGFRIELAAEGEGVSELLLEAVLEDLPPIPLWRIRINASRKAPADADTSPSTMPEETEGGNAAPVH